MNGIVKSSLFCLFIGLGNLSYSFTYWVTLRNDTSNPVTVRILTACSSKHDFDRVIQPGKTESMSITGGCCFSRIKVNGLYPKGNWYPGAKCWDIEGVIYSDGGKIAVREQTVLQQPYIPEVKGG